MKLTPALSIGLMALFGSCQNVIKLTPALSNPTIPMGRQKKRETGGGEGGRRFID